MQRAGPGTLHPAGGLWHTRVPVPQSGNLYPAGPASFLPAASHRKEVAVPLPASDLPYNTMLFFRVRNGIGYPRRRQKRNALCPHAADGPGLFSLEDGRWIAHNSHPGTV